jgi:hypothetical protein
MVAQAGVPVQKFFTLSWSAPPGKEGSPDRRDVIILKKPWCRIGEDPPS